MSKPLKIAITADPEIPVPPVLYGGIERIIYMLINDLQKRGHQVSLFAHLDSAIEGRLYPYPNKTNGSRSEFLRNAWLINKTLLGEKFDIIHSFGRLLYLLPQLPLPIPKLMSYQREPTLSQIQRAVKVSKRGSLAFTGCSNYISNQISPFAPSYTVYNGIDLNTYTYKECVSENAPLVFLGRIEPIKGTHIAIQIAKQTGKKLIIAGNIPKDHIHYFKEKVEPYFNDHIKYIGPVNDQQKNELLGKSAALLMPIEWNEPFGIVMVEAMACGTPVLALSRGAVPEVVRNGITGFVCNNIEEMTNSVFKINKLNRAAVRNDCENRFSASVIVENYIEIYQQLISSNA